jgi:hypothetical protein
MHPLLIVIAVETVILGVASVAALVSFIRS